MKLIALSSPDFFSDEADRLNELFNAGLTCLHLRKPESNEADFGGLLSKINPAYLGNIAIHQHHRLAEVMGIKKLHFTEAHRKNTSVQKLETLFRRDFTLSTSVHHPADIEGLPGVFSYTFLGPVFDSISKSGYNSSLAASFILESNTKGIEVIALGGIQASNIGTISKMNFHGAAVLGTLWKNPKNAVARFTELYQLIKQNNQPQS